MPRNMPTAIVAVSVLAPLALVSTGASAQSVIPPFHPSTIQMPRTTNQPTYAPTYAPTSTPTYSYPSVKGEKLPKAAGNLSGIWSASYPGGPLRVRVMHRGSTLVATLIDGNIAVPAGKVTVHAAGVARTFLAQQICAYPGYLGAHFVDARFTVADDGRSMKEDLIGSCGVQSSVEWGKIK